MPRNGLKLALLASFAVGATAVAMSQARKRSGAAGRQVDQAGRDGRLRVVILGGGFGGLEAAKPLAGVPGIDLTLVDARNHHLFQPLLYQVATAALSPSDIATPLRTVLPAAEGVRLVMATATGVDTARREVRCGDRSIAYDRLVIATGSRPSYLGHDAWAAAAPSLKSLEDAVRLRNMIISAFESAAWCQQPRDRDRFLTFVLIGGGPTGVEMAGAIAQYVQDRLLFAYDLAPERVRILLVEAGRRVLAGFAPDLSARAAAELRSLGVELRTGTKVTSLEAGEVQLGDEVIEAETVIWTAGTQATPVADWLGVEPGHGGRVAVGGDLRVAGQDGVFVIGDAALARDAAGRGLPGLAPVAKQQGTYVADLILRDLRGDPEPAPFRYRDYGTLATVGRNKAVAQFGPLHLSGFPAWLLWAGAHIVFLVSFRNRVAVCLQWAFAYVTHRRSAGLIIGEPGTAGPEKPPA